MPDSSAIGLEPRRRPRWRRLVLLCAAGYLALALVLSFFETQLVYPGSRWKAVASGFDFPAEAVQLEAQDGTELHGWLLEHPTPRAHILYCYGNGSSAEQLASRLDQLRSSAQASVLVMDYRGYGRSGGTPREDDILADLEQAHAWLCARAGLAADELVLMGRSLGGGVVAHLAATFGARGLILERTFTSLPEIAAQRFPFLPVRLMMRNRYPSAEKLADYAGPLLQSHGSEDRLVPFDNGRRLFDAVGSRDKRFVEMPGLGHNDPDSKAYLAELERFLQGL